MQTLPSVPQAHHLQAYWVVVTNLIAAFGVDLALSAPEGHSMTLPAPL
jgi:hypothetical protein